MSDFKRVLNRRDLLGQLGFTFAGAVILGSTMHKCLREQWIATSEDMLLSRPETLPEGTTVQEVHEASEEYYAENLQPSAQKITTALGSVIGYVSYDYASKPSVEPDIY